MSAAPAHDQLIAQAIQFHSAGQIQQAEQIYRQILGQNPNHPDALHLLGVIAHQVGQLAAAAELMSRAISIQPLAIYYGNIAEVYRQLGRIPEAEGAARRAVELMPTLFSARVNLAAILMDSGRHEEAESHLRSALQIDPNHAAVLGMLGNVLLKKGQVEEAIELGQRAAERAPADPVVHNNLAAALERAGRFEEALASYSRANQFRPDHPELLTNLGTIRRKLGDLNGAVADWKRVTAINPEHPDANWNLGLAYLTAGDFERGWPLYEWRLRCESGRAYRREYPVPCWDGSEIAGKRILLYPEQGYGDVIMFARFIREVAKRGGRVVFHCPSEMIDLMRGVAGIDQIVRLDDEPGDFDMHLPLLSLPSVLRTGLEDLAKDAPYIQADADRVERWRGRISAEPGELRVGLCFRGRALPDASRSCSLAEFAPLAEVPGIRLFSLQVNEGREEVAPLAQSLRLTDLAGDLHDFSDTAAAIAHLDLLISIDTAAAHLAGAMGARVWTMIPHVPDFRWMLDREDSPWYPTMRLFRQTRRGQWGDVILRLKDELSRLRK